MFKKFAYYYYQITYVLNISFLACTKVELLDLIVCITVNGEKFQRHAMTLTLVGQCPILNLSELFSYATMCINFMFLDELLFEFLKSAVQTLNHSNVVYRINCTDCYYFYIGLISRRLHKRLQEHKKGNIVQCINIQKQAIVLIGTILKLLDMIM